MGSAGDGIKLHAAMAHVASTFPGVFHAPGWHRTPDRCLPHRALWAWFAMIDAVDARHQLAMIAATSIAYHGGEETPTHLQEIVERVSPP